METASDVLAWQEHKISCFCCILTSFYLQLMLWIFRFVAMKTRIKSLLKSKSEVGKGVSTSNHGSSQAEPASSLYASSGSTQQAFQGSDAPSSASACGNVLVSETENLGGTTLLDTSTSHRERNYGNDRTSTISFPTKKSRIEELWFSAYRKLEEAEPRLLQAYRSVLVARAKESESEAQCVDPQSLSSDLHDIISERQQAIKFDSRWTVEVAGLRLDTRQISKKAIGILKQLKESAAPAASVEPHAALAWIGVCIVLPLIFNIKDQDDSLKESIEKVGHIVSISRKRAEIYLGPEDPHCNATDDAFIELYHRILRYQARLALQLCRPTLYRALRNSVKADNWAEMTREIMEQDGQCQIFLDLTDKELQKRAIRKQTTFMEGFEKRHLQAIRDLQSSQTGGKEQEALQCLFSTYEEYKNLNPQRLPGTCEWVIQSKLYQEWQVSLTSETKVLWFSADPGCGKSVLSRSLIDEGLMMHASENIVCYFFFKDGISDRTTAAGALKAIAHQLFRQRPDLIQDHLLKLYKQAGSKLAESFDDLWTCVIGAAQDPAAGKVIILFDALDEAVEEEREKITKALRLLRLDDVKANLKFFITSRPYMDIRQSFTLDGTSICTQLDASLESEAISQDIDLLIDYEMPHTCFHLEKGQQRRIAQSLKSTQNRTYLWLYLTLQEIRRRAPVWNTERKIIQGIQHLPPSVDRAYDAILQRVNETAEAKVLLQIVVAAREPLSVANLNVAYGLAVDPACEEYKDLDLPPDTAFTAHLQDICGLFLQVHHNRVYFLHQTAREFLLKAVSEKWYAIDVEEAEELMMRITLQLLSFKEFRNGRRAVELLNNQVFYYYASCYWQNHAIACPRNLSDLTTSKLMLFGQPGSTSFINAIDTLKQTDDLDGDHGLPQPTDNDNASIGPLHLAAALGQTALMRALLKSFDININNSYYGSPLFMACLTPETTTTEFIKFLLDNGADPNQLCEFGTPLIAAVNSDHSIEVVRMLLERDADPNIQGGSYGNAVMTAITFCKTDKLELLLDYGANPNKGSSDYNTPLGKARRGARNSDEMVSMLEARGAILSGKER